MGFLKSLFGGGQPKTAPQLVTSDNLRWCGINGIDHYQDTLRPHIHKAVTDFRQERDVDLYVTLTPDPTIQYVPDAIRVDVGGQRIGHLPATVTPAVNEFMARVGVAQLVAVARFDWERKAGPFDGRVQLPRDFVSASLRPV